MQYRHLSPNVRKAFGLALIATLLAALLLSGPLVAGATPPVPDHRAPRILGEMMAPLGIGDAENVEFVGHLGGATYTVAVAGNHAYIGDGPSLTILDISNPASLAVAGKTPPLPGVVQGVAVAGGYAYVAASDGGLRVADVSTPSAPVEVGFYDTPGEAQGVAVDGDYAYVADFGAGLRVVDVSTPSAPVEVGFYDTPGWALDVAVAGGYAYVADSHQGLRVVDVSTPSAPAEVGLYDTVGRARGVVVVADYAYLADDTAGLRVVDVSTPSSPTQVGFYDTPGYARGVAVVGGYAYVADDDAGLRVVDVSTPSAPAEVGFYDTPGEAWGAAAAGDYAYVADGMMGLRVVDVSAPPTPTEVSFYQTPTEAYDVEVAGGYAYVADRWHGLRVVDVSTPSAPAEVGFYETPGLAYGVAVVGDYAYVAESTGMRVVDVSTPSAPAEVGFSGTPGLAYGVVVVGGYAYVAEDDAGLRVVDVSTPSAPVEVGFHVTPGTAYAVAIAGGYAYVADGDGGLRVVDVSTPSTPAEVGFNDTLGYAMGVAVVGGYAYVAAEDSGLRVVDVSMPSAPVEVGFYDTPTWAKDVAVADEYAYVSDGEVGLRVVDVLIPSAPVEAGFYDTSNALSAALAGDYAYVADGETGLYILRFTGCRKPSSPEPVSPLDGSSTCDATPTFDWSPVDGATSYRIQVAADEGFTSPVVDATTEETSYTPDTDLAPGAYYWRVLATNDCGEGEWSPVWGFTLAAAPAGPALSSPPDGGSTCDVTPTFDWSPVTGATSYRIQVAADEGFTSPVVDATMGETSYVTETDLAPGAYYWRVLAANDCGEGEWSATWSFTLLPKPPPPALLSPANGGTTCDTTPAFEWSPVDGATSYRIQMAADTAFTSPLVDATTTGTSYTPESDLPPGTSYWRVLAANDCGEGQWSPIWGLTVTPTPSPPVLLSPPDEGSTCSARPTFEWSPEPGAVNYRIQVDDNSNFASPLVNAKTASATYMPISSLPTGAYYWRVRALSPCGNSAWSTKWQFAIVPPPAGPALSKPPDGASTCETTPAFEWAPVSEAVSYTIQVDTQIGFPAPVVSATTSYTGHVPVAPLSSGTYHWHVRSLDSCGNGGWSPAWSFSARSITAAPDLSLPAGGTSTCEATPAFQWSAVEWATSYQIQVDDKATFASPVISATTPYTDYVPVSTLAPGTYHWRVRAANECGAGVWSPAQDFRVLADPCVPALAWPPDEGSACRAQLGFEWLPVSGAKDYRIQVDDNRNFSSPLVNERVPEATYMPVVDLAPGTYYWRVRTFSPYGRSAWSSKWQFSVETTPSLPVLGAPPDGGTTCEATPDLKWAAVTGAMFYTVQVDTDVGFPAPVIEATTQVAGYSPGVPLPADTYYWRVRASNQCGDGDWAPAWSFALLAMPSAPALKAPADGGSTCERLPTFQWAEVSGAESYQIQVADDPSFASPEVDLTTGDCQCTPEAPLPPGTCYWRVRAANVCGASAWSSPWNVRISNCQYLPVIWRDGG